MAQDRKGWAGSATREAETTGTARDGEAALGLRVAEGQNPGPGRSLAAWRSRETQAGLTASPDRRAAKEHRKGGQHHSEGTKEQKPGHTRRRGGLGVSWERRVSWMEDKQ